MVRRGKELGLRVALSDVLPWNNGWPGAEPQIRRLNALIAELASDESIPVLRFHDTLEDPDRPGRGREQDRDVGSRRVALQDLAHAKAVDAAKQEIEDDGVWQFLAGPVERFQAILRGEDVEALLLQSLDARSQPFRIVIRDQNSPGRALLAHATLPRGPCIRGSGCPTASCGARRIISRAA